MELSGAMITRVTLHNFGMVNEFQLKSGDEIELVRSGEVIPKFLGVVQSSNNRYDYPVKCPSCDSPVRVEDIRLICDNINCKEKIIDQILNFVQKIGIDDLSEKRIEEMLEKNVIKDAADLYNLKMEDLLSLDKVKDKLAQKIIKNIEKTTNIEIVTFLTALGINGGAINKCDKIVRAGYNDLEQILNLTVNELCNIEGFAEKSATEFISSLSEKNALVKKLLLAGVKIKPVIFASEKLKGLSFCITGSLTMKRADLQKLISDNGGENVNSVSKQTKYLITNDVQSDSSKFKKAKELSVKILTENEFLQLLEK